MDHEDAELATVKALNAEARRALETHPSSDEILAYHEQALPTGATESLRDHLALCPDCAERALDLAALAQPELFLEEDDPPAATADAEWDAVRQALDQGDRPPASSTVVSLPRGKHKLFSSLLFAYATAAVFFLTSLGLSVWLSMELLKVAGPQAGPRLVDLEPVAVLHRDGGVAPAGTIDVHTEHVLILSISSVDQAKLDLGADLRPPRAGYRAEIIDLRTPEHPVIWSHEGLELVENFCTIKIPGHSLRSGSYGIKLYSPGGVDLAQYRFEIEES